MVGSLIVIDTLVGDCKFGVVDDYLRKGVLMYRWRYRGIDGNLSYAVAVQECFFAYLLELMTKGEAADLWACKECLFADSLDLRGEYNSTMFDA